MKANTLGELIEYLSKRFDVSYAKLARIVVKTAKWQKEQMLKDAVEGYVNYYEDSGGILMAEAQVGCPYHNGDKVKIIIVKEGEV